MDAATLNLILLGILAVFALNGLRRGFLLGLYDLLSLAVIVAVAVDQNRRVGALVVPRLGLPAVAAPVVGYVVILVLGEAARLLGSLLVRAILGPVFAGAPGLRFFDRVGGLLPGLARGLVILSVALLLIGSLPSGSGLVSTADQSPVGGVVVTVRNLLPLVPALADPMPTSTSAAPATPLPAAVPAATDAQIDPGDEAQLLAMTNLARTQAGLPDLVLDNRLVDVARQHSLEMYRQGYFAHNSPSLGSPVDRLDAAGIPFQTAGENLAYAPSAEDAFLGLMASAEHRQNILSPNYRRVGIGVARSKLWGIVVTEDFAN